MLLIWRGLGFVIPILVFAISLIAELISESITKDDNFYQSNLIPLGFALLFSSFLLSLLNKQLKKSKPKILIEKETGKEVFLQKKHDFFFIPMLYWSYLIAATGLVVIIIQLFK